jgi:hypothetical protein
MSNETEIEKCAPLVLNLIFSSPIVVALEDEGRRLNEIVETLQKLFDRKQSAIESILRDVSIDAPLTFAKCWPTINSAILATSSGNDHSRAIFLLGRLLGWAYIETAWNSQIGSTQNWTLGSDNLATLAAIQMGLPAGTSTITVLNIILVNSNLYSQLLLNRFEQTVIGGLEQVGKLGARVDEWEKRLNESEGRVNEAEGKINAYNDTLKEYKVAFGFLAMAKAYKSFFDRKIIERDWLRRALFVLFTAIVSLPILGYKFANAPQETMWVQLENYIPFAVLIFLFIYFFRVVLFHYNSTQAQLLQLEIRTASLSFIQDYVKFLKDNDSPDLSKFESRVFGGIVADLDKVPSTFDGLESLVKSLMQLKGEK